MTPNPNNVRGESCAGDVLAKRAAWSCAAMDCVRFLDALPAASVQLVIGSPHYACKGGRYTTGGSGDADVKRLDVIEWVDWMLDVTTAARRVSAGDVVWVVNGPVEGGSYGPAVEGLLWRWYMERGPKLDDVEDAGDRLPGKLERPVIWTKNAPPNRADWFGNDFEFCICFPAPGRRNVWRGERIATAPKYDTGGHFRQRGADGKRKEGGAYPTNPLTRPRDVLRVTVGGGHMGHKRAHDNEACYPLKLVEPFVLALTDPGDVVCDPFCGSGTTCQAAIENGRGFVGADIRESQVQLTRERMGTVSGW